MMTNDTRIPDGTLPSTVASSSETFTSRLSHFRRAAPAERRRLLALALGLGAGDLDGLADGALDCLNADKMIENAIGVLGVPLGVALNFVIDGTDVLVPMCIEEPSVIAAASHAAKLVRDGGGFQASSTLPIMISQVEVRGVADTAAAEAIIERHTTELCAAVDAALPNLAARGGGACGVRVRTLERAEAGDVVRGRIVVHLHLDCRDAMGANLCNTAAEAVAPRIAALVGGDVGLRILSNLNDQRMTTVRAVIPFASLERSDADGARQGADVAAGIAEASRFAELDPYRAATHNKGIFNGIDAVALATGQDWRAIEAGGHAFAALVRPDLRYAPLSRWWADSTRASLLGELTLPLAVGTVGGATRIHDGVRLALTIAGSPDARRLAAIAASAGLASNLAALRALATDGIQRGHMALHRRYREEG